MRTLFSIAILLVAATLAGHAFVGQEPAPPVLVTPIEPPSTPFPSEAASAGVTRFSFLAYGDSRGGVTDGVIDDGKVLNAAHDRLMDVILAKVHALSSTPFPVRFALHSGDAVLQGANAAMWNVSFSPIVARLTHGAGIPFFFAAGNHDVTGMPMGDPRRAAGLQNLLAAMSKLIPPNGSTRRLTDYPAYAIGFGNVFAITLDSNVVSEPTQLAWVRDQLEHLDRTRFHHVVAFFHHPVFSSGLHGVPDLEPWTSALRDLYMPLFRRHQVRLLITGHDHLFEHWIERYTDKEGRLQRLDQIVSGGGGAPVYVYRGEPDLRSYLTSSAGDRVAVEHLAKPGRTPAENPYHFIVIQVDGDRLSLEVIGAGAKFEPYSGRSRVDLFDRTS